MEPLQSAVLSGSTPEEPNLSLMAELPVAGVPIAPGEMILPVSDLNPDITPSTAALAALVRQRIQARRRALEQHLNLIREAQETIARFRDVLHKPPDA